MLSLTIDSVFTRPERIMFAPKVWAAVLLAAVLALTLATEVSSGHSTMPTPGSHHGMIRRRGLIESILRGGEFGSTDTPAPTTTRSTSTSRTHSATHKPSSSSSSSSDSGQGKTYEGEATHYQPGLGSCGDNSDASEMVVAVSHSKYDAKAKSQNPNENPFCGKKVKVTYEGKSIEVKVVDRCPGCSENDLDLSPSAFKKLAPLGKGRLKQVKWKMID